MRQHDFCLRPIQPQSKRIPREAGKAGDKPRYRTDAHRGGFSKKDYPSLMFMGVADFLANLLLGVACNNGSVSVAMVLGSMYPIATAILAFRFLRERLHKIQYVGIVLAVSGVALISAF